MSVEDLAALRALAVERSLRRLREADRVGEEFARLRRTVAAELTERHATGEGLVATARDAGITHAILWRDGTHPLTGHHERQFFQLLEGAGTDRPPTTPEWGELIGRAERLAPAGTDRLQAEIGSAERAGQLGAALLAAGFRDQILHTHKTLAVPGGEEPAGLRSGAVLRALRDDELWFAVACVRRAIVQALAAPVEGRRVTEFVTSWLNTIDHENLRSYVVEHRGRPVAHALVSLTQARHRPAPEASLIDVMVPDAEQRGHGWSRLLTGWIGTTLAREGVRDLRATVVVPDGDYPHALVRDLRQAGWWVESVSMTKELR
ncbi:hypothetical protein OG455_28190 [Kitasatospora sp. NBC_01287]|uniref:hypothetical protein n=1 Tax=Kitasatospora sp. NBC_01287 TaxID=2903573 RepID=UPI00225A40E7|nr:hypothetical protein [Kitasatospora sp. NBC_01287]MCX4749342.1 hypothetical protein [Kitasatospora sp. NBC_01287]